MTTLEIRGNATNNGIAEIVGRVVADPDTGEIILNGTVITTEKNVNAQMRIAENIWQALDAWA